VELEGMEDGVGDVGVLFSNRLGVRPTG